jgi:hypothetical protein
MTQNTQNRTYVTIKIHKNTNIYTMIKHGTKTIWKNVIKETAIQAPKFIWSISSNNGRHHVTKIFITFHYTSPNYTSLHFSTLVDTSLPFIQTSPKYTSLPSHLAYPNLNSLPLHFTSHHYTSLHFTQLHFTPLQYTCRHFTSFYSNFTQIYFTTLSLGLSQFKFPTAPLHFTSPHITTLHLTSLHCAFTRFSPHFSSFHFTQYNFFPNPVSKNFRFTRESP